MSALLHSKEFSALLLLIVTERLPGLMSLLEATQPTCPIYYVPQKIMDNIAGFHISSWTTRYRRMQSTIIITKIFTRSSRKSFDSGFM
ncbi:hypothetical protein RM11_0889 [Bartonella quintana RM-11]|nr:hypothetical protein RM11_0889 [Bartonella quintana RM-11]